MSVAECLTRTVLAEGASGCIRFPRAPHCLSKNSVVRFPLSVGIGSLTSLRSEMLSARVVRHAR